MDVNGIIETVNSSLRELIGSAVVLLPAILTAIVILFLTRYFATFSRKVAINIGKRTLRSHSLRLLLTRTASIGAWVSGILFACIIAFPGLDLGDLIAALGLSSVAIGFAFQDIFKNFLAGILLLIDEPFRINDQVVIGEYEGTIERVDIRTTQIRTYQGERVLLPNSTVFTSAVKVRTAYDYRRTDLAVGVDYNTSLPKAAQILRELITGVEGVLDNPEPEIDLVNFNDSSIDFVVRYWTASPMKQVRHVQTRAIVAIKKAFDQADINIPYPIRTVYHYDQEQFNDYVSTASNGNSQQ